MKIGAFGAILSAPGIIVLIKLLIFSITRSLQIIKMVTASIKGKIWREYMFTNCDTFVPILFQEHGNIDPGPRMWK